MFESYRTMYDSVTPDQIPAGRGDLVVGDIDGRYAWTPENWDRFAQNVKVLITVTGDLRAQVADCESSDLTPQQVRTWIEKREAAGLRGTTVYVNRQNLPKLISACRGLHYYLWVADWTGHPHQVPGAVATQYYNDPSQAYDLSAVYDMDWVSLIDAANRPWPLDATVPARTEKNPPEVAPDPEHG